MPGVLVNPDVVCLNEIRECKDKELILCVWLLCIIFRLKEV